MEVSILENVKHLSFPSRILFGLHAVHSSKYIDMLPLKRFHPQPKAGRLAATMFGSILCVADINVGLVHPTEVHVYTLVHIYVYIDTHCTHVLHMSTLDRISYNIIYIISNKLYTYMYISFYWWWLHLGTHTHNKNTTSGRFRVINFFRGPIRWCFLWTRVKTQELVAYCNTVFVLLIAS